MADGQLLAATASSALHVATALLFAAAALPKLRDPAIFAGVVANYRILPRMVAAPFARALPVVEAALAFLLAVPLHSVLPALAAAALLLVFAAAMAINIARGREEIDCGCRGGEMRQTLRLRFVLRNVVWAGLLGLSALAPSPAALPTFLLGLVAGSALFLFQHVLELLWGLPAPVRHGTVRSGSA